MLSEYYFQSVTGIIRVVPRIERKKVKSVEDGDTKWEMTPRPD